MNEPKDFKELVTWATWKVISGITCGEKLESVLHYVLVYARQWQPKEKTK
jgi:hypothetical protein